MKKVGGVIYLCLTPIFGWCVLCAAEDIQTIPVQTDMKAEVIVSGHTSTEKNIEVVNIGKQIPRTFGGVDLANVDGFTWYVSKHFALRTDYPEAEATFKLKLLELAYPHYVELLGEPIDILQKRVACVFGTSYQATTAVMMADNFERGPNGGGEAMYYNNVAYCFPANAYHNRYILLHETAHAFQFASAGKTCSMPCCWYVEGIADGLSDHLYEPDKKRLTVLVLNTWGGHDWLREGLQSHRLNQSWPGGSRGQNVLAIQFFMSDPILYSKFHAWQDEMFRIDPEGEMIYTESDRLLNEIFGSPEVLEQSYLKWASELKSVIQRVEGFWQLGVTDFSIGDVISDRQNSVLLNLPPGKPLDEIYQAERIGLEATQLIGPVKCGVDEPVVGCLIDYNVAPTEKSKVGLGLGVINVADIDSFKENMFYSDQACNKKGINVSAHRLGQVVNGGMRSEDVINGEFIGSGVDSKIALGLAGSPTEGLTENFVVEWDGWLQIPEDGMYVFAANSDDGSWLWIDDELIVENGGYHGALDKVGHLKLNKGIHAIRARFFQGGGAYSVAITLIEDQEKPGSLDLLVSGGSSFVIEGELLGINRQVLHIPDDVALALTTGVCRAGITAELLDDELRVDLRVENKKSCKKPVLSASVPLTSNQHKRLVDRPVALLARQTACRLNVYLDESQRYHDLLKPAPANPWRSESYNALRRVVKACWRLGNDVPSSLVKMRDSLNDAMLDEKNAREKSLPRFNRKLHKIARDVIRTGSENVDLALADLAGLTMDLTHDSNKPCNVVAVMRNRGEKPADGVLTVNVVSSNGVRIAGYTNEFTVRAQNEIRVGPALSRQDNDEDHRIETVVRFREFDNTIELRANTTRWPVPWLGMDFDPAYSFIGSTGVTGRIIFTGPIQQAAIGNVTLRVKQKDAVEHDEVTKSITVNAGEKRTIPFFFKWKKNSTPISIEAEAHVLHINEQIMLKDVLEVNVGTGTQ